MGKALFVAGTGTDVGKTYVTGLIVKKLRTAGYRAGYYKAALSGAEPDAQGALVPGDVRHVQEAVLRRSPTSTGRRCRRISRHGGTIVPSIPIACARILHAQRTTMNC